MSRACLRETPVVLQANRRVCGAADHGLCVTDRKHLPEVLARKHDEVRAIATGVRAKERPVDPAYLRGFVAIFDRVPRRRFPAVRRRTHALISVEQSMPCQGRVSERRKGRPPQGPTSTFPTTGMSSPAHDLSLHTTTRTCPSTSPVPFPRATSANGHRHSPGSRTEASCGPTRPRRAATTNGGTRRSTTSPHEIECPGGTRASTSQRTRPGTVTRSQVIVASGATPASCSARAGAKWRATPREAQQEQRRAGLLHGNHLVSGIRPSRRIASTSPPRARREPGSRRSAGEASLCRGPHSRRERPVGIVWSGIARPRRRDPRRAVRA